VPGILRNLAHGPTTRATPIAGQATSVNQTHAPFQGSHQNSYLLDDPACNLHPLRTAPKYSSPKWHTPRLRTGDVHYPRLPPRSPRRTTQKPRLSPIQPQKHPLKSIRQAATPPTGSTSTRQSGINTAGSKPAHSNKEAVADNNAAATAEVRQSAPHIPAGSTQPETQS
jgi:hypothetical protein